jgi:hypothetical protein
VPTGLRMKGSEIDAITAAFPEVGKARRSTLSPTQNSRESAAAQGFVAVECALLSA